MRHVLPVLLLPLAPVLAATALSSQDERVGSAEKRRTDDSIHELIRQLASDDFETREKATQRLMKLDAAEPALRKALASAEPDPARRIRRALDAINQRRLPRELMRIRADGRAGRADLLAERVALWKGAHDEPGCWQPVLDLYWRLLALNSKTFRELMDSKPIPQPSFRLYLKEPGLTFLPPGNPTVSLTAWNKGVQQLFVMRGRQALMRGEMRGSLVVSAGNAHIDNALETFVLAGGPVEMKKNCQYMVVACDGDFSVGEIARGNVIVARGSVRCRESVTDCVILAGGDVHLRGGLVKGNVIRCGGRLIHPKGMEILGCEIKERDPRALDCVRFFETAEAGVEVAPAKQAVRVTTVAGDKPFAKAGLKADDLILEVDGEATPTSDHFRRLLRRKVVEGGETRLRVRRDGKTLLLQVRVGP